MHVATFTCSCRWLRHCRREAPKWPCCANAVVVYLLYLHIVNCSFLAAYGQSQEAIAFVAQKEQEVTTIADAALENWKQLSQLDCSSESTVTSLKESCSQNCSVDECNVLERDIVALSCAKFDNTDNLTGCSRGFAPCNTIQADYRQGFVSFPDWRTTITNEVDFSVCAQQKLDTTFKKLKNQGSDPNATYFFNFYFASVDGSMRSYPGRQGQNCTQKASSHKPYDPRTRPWYTGAISVNHQLVILLDCGISMNSSLGHTEHGSRFEYAQSFAAELLDTSMPGSEVNIITYNESSAASASDVFVSVTAGFKDLLQFVQNSKVAAVESNITVGISKAIKLLSSYSAKSNDISLKIIMILTDGTSDESSDNLDMLSAQLQQESIKLFLYQIGISNTNAVTKFACGAGGQVEPIKVKENELYHARSYFSFLAKCHVASEEVNPENGTQNLAFWQKVYPDRSILGDVITVSYPAILGDELIGVAGIDIQMGGFDLDIGLVLGDAQPVFHYRPGLNDTLQCKIAIPPPPDCRTLSGRVGALCRDANRGLRPADMTVNHLCCPSCRPPGPKSKVAKIVGGAIGGVVGVIIVALAIWFAKRWRISACCSRSGIKPPSTVTREKPT